MLVTVDRACLAAPRGTSPRARAPWHRAVDNGAVASLPSKRDVFRYLGTKQWFARAAARLAPLDTRVLRASGGRFGLLGSYGLPQLLLTTTGRKSGQQRTVTLLYGRSDDGIVLIGSNFGQAHHPAWALNLEATPQAVVQIGDQTTPVVARLVTDSDEREQIWSQMIDIYPGYAMYRSTAGRDIKVFAVRPAEQGATLV
jgi:deazaflavin-dependent oxidoreductase (nitroreductase family)